jgi:hypothetical protein
LAERLSRLAEGLRRLTQLFGLLPVVLGLLPHEFRSVPLAFLDLLPCFIRSGLTRHFFAMLFGNLAQLLSGVAELFGHLALGFVGVLGFLWHGTPPWHVTLCMPLQTETTTRT